jgi:hypothetical protein
LNHLKTLAPGFFSGLACFPLEFVGDFLFVTFCALELDDEMVGILASSSLGSWNMSTSDACLNINDKSDSIFVRSFKLIESPVDLIGFDHDSVWPNLMLGTDIEDLLSGFHSTD